MVQYIFTPWRDRAELLAVRRQFYPERCRGERHPDSRSRSHSHSPPPSPHYPLPTRSRFRHLEGGSANSSSEAAQRGGSEGGRSWVGGGEKDGDGDGDGDEDGEKRRRRRQQQAAVARVSVWMHRGGCPHLVESTALLTAAMLSDGNGDGDGLGLGSGLGPGRRGTRVPGMSGAEEGGGSLLAAAGGGADGAVGASRAYAVRAAYSAAFSRFVTGLLDSHQDKQRKMSMYDVAKAVGLPATFVELRHQATHEQLPSLTRLRAAARKALDWIWDYYWRHLAGPPPPPQADRDGGGADEVPEEGKCRELLARYLETEHGDEEVGREIMRLDEALVLTTLGSISEGTRDVAVLRRAVALTRRILEGWRDPDRMDEDGATEVERLKKDVGRVRAELNKAWEEVKAMAMKQAEDGREVAEQVEVGSDAVEKPGWSLYEEDQWVPKPIGVV